MPIEVIPTRTRQPSMAVLIFTTVSICDLYEPLCGTVGSDDPSAFGIFPDRFGMRTHAAPASLASSHKGDAARDKPAPSSAFGTGRAWTCIERRPAAHGQPAASAVGGAAIRAGAASA